MIKVLLPLTASTTFAAGGTALITMHTPVAMGVFVSGVGAVCYAAYWLGQKVSELKVIGQQLREGHQRFERIEKRLIYLENNPNVIAGNIPNNPNNMNKR